MRQTGKDIALLSAAGKVLATVILNSRFPTLHIHCDWK